MFQLSGFCCRKVLPLHARSVYKLRTAVYASSLDSERYRTVAAYPWVSRSYLPTLGPKVDASHILGARRKHQLSDRCAATHEAQPRLTVSSPAQDARF